MKDEGSIAALAEMIESVQDQGMRFLCLQHHPIEGPGAVARWMEAAGHQFTVQEAWTTDFARLPGDLAGVVLMGGPMSVRDTETYPWLEAEIAWLREWIDGGGRVLGFCLGAQLIATALGAAVRPMPQKEIGWFPIWGERPFFPAGPFMVYHWHGEMFSLPPGAHLLARSEACAHQAFHVGPRVIGLQFHLEIGPEENGRMLATFSGELEKGGPHVQTAAALREGTDRFAAATAAWLEHMLSNWSKAPLVCARCGRNDAKRFGGAWICDECLANAGACCHEQEE